MIALDFGADYSLGLVYTIYLWESSDCVRLIIVINSCQGLAERHNRLQARAQPITGPIQTWYLYNLPLAAWMKCILGQDWWIPYLVHVLIGVLPH